MPDTGSQGPNMRLYESMRMERDLYLDRARQSARYTIPSLMPEEGFNQADVLPTPYQGLGQRGLANLGSKLLLTIFPSTTPFFKLDIDDFQLATMLPPDPEAAHAKRGEIEQGFNAIERAVTTDLEATTIGVALGEALKQILVAGNVVFLQLRDGNAKVYRLNQFCVRRSPSGKVLDVVIKEQVSPRMLSAAQRAAVGVEDQTSEEERDPSDVLDLYTWYREQDGKWVATQEINGHQVPDTFNSWPLDFNPLIVPTMNRLPGENYGRGYVETVCLGDLISYEGLSKHTLEGASMAAKFLYMRNPNGTTRAKDLERENGAVINGSVNDVSVLKADKTNDLAFAQQMMATLERRLEQAFLLNSGVQRQAERVTAEEIRFMAQDIEDALGGVYSVLAVELQNPLVKFQLKRLTIQKRIPPLPEGIVRPRITTGLQALGRGHDLAKIKGFTADLANFGGPETHQRFMHMDELGKRLGNGHGIDLNGLFKTRKEVAADDQAAMQNTLQQNAMDPAVLKQALSEVLPGMLQQALPQATK